MAFLAPFVPEIVMGVGSLVVGSALQPESGGGSASAAPAGTGSDLYMPSSYVTPLAPPMPIGYDHSAYGPQFGYGNGAGGYAPAEYYDSYHSGSMWG
jgi:hypothetical protein